MIKLFRKKNFSLFSAVAAGKLPLGMLRPSDEEDLEDEESVAFFQNAEEELVGAPLSYDAVSLGNNHHGPCPSPWATAIC